MPEHHFIFGLFAFAIGGVFGVLVRHAGSGEPERLTHEYLRGRKDGTEVGRSLLRGELIPFGTDRVPISLSNQAFDALEVMRRYTDSDGADQTIIAALQIVRRDLRQREREACDKQHC